MITNVPRLNVNFIFVPCLHTLEGITRSACLFHPTGRKRDHWLILGNKQRKITFETLFSPQKLNLINYH